MSLTNEQENAVKVLLDRYNKNEKITVLQGPAGSGKALVHGTLVPVLEGFVKVENVKVGDYVFGRDGHPTKVIGVYPQGITRNFLITFEDGRQSKCSSDHLWPCYTSKGNLKIFTTQQIFERGVYENIEKPSNGYKFKVPLCEGVEYPFKQTSLDPYLIGLLLGDGCTLQSKLTISSTDDFLIEEFCKITGFEAKKENGNCNWFFQSSSENVLTKQYLKKYKEELINYSYNKRIPKEFLYNSKEVRYSLLQGLMDTDGSVDLKGRCSFVTTSEGLKNDFLQLVYSLGYMASVSEDKRKEKYTKSCYLIQIQTTEEEKLNFFRLPRKKERIEQKIKKNNHHRNYDRIAIIAVEQVEDAFSTCLAVDNEEKLFLTQDFIVTHNSYTLHYLMDYLGSSPRNVAFAAFTGTAAKILINKNLNASTIHKLIYNPIMRRGTCVGFKRKDREELSHLKLIVVDEFSMVSDAILKDLLYFNIPIILVGDKNQLPPIGEPNRFINLSHAALTEPVRQALDNPILWAANEIRLGNRLSKGIHGDILFVGHKSQLQQDWLRPDVRIIAGLNATRKKINRQIAGSDIPMVGHRIIFLKNDWGSMITNGTTAEIENLNLISFSSFKLDFITDDDMIFKEYKADFQKQTSPKKQFFDFAYCLTAHKAQGATYDSPGLIIDESNYFKEYKNHWLYTAITRYTGKYNVAILQ